MPLYDYDCPECGQPFEKRVRMDEADHVACPACGSEKTRRKLSRIAIKGEITLNTISAPAPSSGSL